MAAVFVRLLLIGAAVFLLAGAGFAVIEYVRPIDRAGNPQHGLSVVIAAVWYPFVLTPVVTVPLAWLALRSRSRRSYSC